MASGLAGAVNTESRGAIALKCDRRKLVRAAVLVAVALAGLALLHYFPLEGQTASTQPLSIVGDVDNVVTLRGVDEGDFPISAIDRDDRRLRAIALSDILEAAGPKTDDYRVFFVGDDGRTAAISGEHLEDNLVVLGQEYGWEAINPRHPISSNIKNLAEVVVVAEDPPPVVSVNVFREGHTLGHYTPGELMTSGYSVRSRPVGTSSKIDGELSLEAEIFQSERIVDLQRLTEGLDFEAALLVGERGEMVPVSARHQLVLGDADLSYRPGRGERPWVVRGVVLDPPRRRNTDIYHDAVRYLDDGVDTMIVLVDGFGWHQYRHLAERDALPYLGSAARPVPALAAYPSITPVNFAAAITGAAPQESGVVARDTRTSQVETIFQWSRERGLKEGLVMGPIAPIDSGTDPVFCHDSNSDGSDDDEVFQNAMEMTGAGYDLLMVHFKGVDSAGHSHGALARETLDTALEIDAYIEELAESWDGRVLVFADHGMKTVGMGGEHGLCLYEDMFVPHWDINTES